jgi:hypothetical protein
MISAAVLGIALVGLVEMHTTSIRGTAKAEDVGRATEIARQLADRVASLPVDQLPGCGSIDTPLGVPGCRATPGPGRSFSNPKGGPSCTRFVDEDAIADAASGQIATLPTEQAGSYRIDTWLSQHPNGTSGAGLLHVWVCWRDPAGVVQEVHTRRMKIAGVW